MPSPGIVYSIFKIRMRGSRESVRERRIIMRRLFLPFIGLAMAVRTAGGKALACTINIAANAVSFGWRPREAYLAGRKRERGRGPSGTGD